MQHETIQRHSEKYCGQSNTAFQKIFKQITNSSAIAKYCKTSLQKEVMTHFLLLSIIVRLQF